MWAGVECTVNRIGDRYFDQLARTGHDVRVTDLDLIAGLGVRTVRYPVLWERTAPTTLGSADWSWPDVRLARLRDLGITPIVGLVHHGSGPVHTSVLDPQFPELLAEYAAAIAARYPWLSLFTPVNEPLTTARSACLYGHWYPHAHDDVSFLRALLHQCKASVLAMRAIRRVRPDAKLIVTEDLGATHSTPQLAYQAAFENARRWLSIDLLCGRIDHTHPLYAWMRGQAITAAELEYFAVNATPPDIIGFNYYLTSERWLDDDCARWPTSAHGGNGRDRYADVHAVLAGQMGGIEPLLRTAWERYGVPLALTEVHLGGTREEQMRWLVEIYDAASRVCASGIDVRAVTAWSLFGCYDWHCLVTRDEGFYEPGVFDVRGPAPRPTALARVVRDLASGVRPDHPVLAHPGFWHRREVA
ncbi:MAG: family 1 glycosylhydrolase [Kofleriaceae bacterium]|nr:family 1 glycosylhydrolase [Kofleriaceae bacterium]